MKITMKNHMLVLFCRLFYQLYYVDAKASMIYYRSSVQNIRNSEVLMTFVGKSLIECQIRCNRNNLCTKIGIVEDVCYLLTSITNQTGTLETTINKHSSATVWQIQPFCCTSGKPICDKQCCEAERNTCASRKTSVLFSISFLRKTLNVLSISRQLTFKVETFALSFWLKVTELNNTSTLFTVSFPSHKMCKGLAIELDPNGKVRIKVSGVESFDLAPGISLSAHKWYFILLWIDGKSGTLDYYFNNEKKVNFTGKIIPPNTTSIQLTLANLADRLIHDKCTVSDPLKGFVGQMTQVNMLQQYISAENVCKNLETDTRFFSFELFQTNSSENSGDLFMDKYPEEIENLKESLCSKI